MEGEERDGQDLVKEIDITVSDILYVLRFYIASGDKRILVK